MIEIDGKGNIVMHLAADLKALAAYLKALATLRLFSYGLKLRCS